MVRISVLLICNDSEWASLVQFIIRRHFYSLKNACTTPPYYFSLKEYPEDFNTKVFMENFQVFVLTNTFICVYKCTDDGYRKDCELLVTLTLIFPALLLGIRKYCRLKHWVSSFIIWYLHYGHWAIIIWSYKIVYSPHVEQFLIFIFNAMSRRLKLLLRLVVA